MICDILTAINYHASRLGFGSCFTEPTCSAEVVLSTGFNSDVSHPIRRKHIINYGQNQQNNSSHPGFEKPGISAFVPKWLSSKLNADFKKVLIAGKITFA